MASPPTKFVLCLLAWLVASSSGMTNWMDAADLTAFVSRPELKVPRLLVTKHHPDLVKPGYIFMAPYIRVDSEPFTKMYQPCQVGPSIYDVDGQLVWSGACIFSNRNPYDFKLSRGVGNKTTLSLLVGPMLRQTGMKGFGAIMGPSLEVDTEVPTANDLEASYMHEFSVLNSNTVLFLQAEVRNVSVTKLTNGNQSHWFVRDEGFREVDLSDGKIKFEWWAMGHVPIEETPDRAPLMDGENFDVYHINSVEKTAFGHYIVSMRHTNTIYMISGQDGHVIWRLGGKQSSFVPQIPFIFSGQHDARIVSEQPNGMIVLSFFDNGGATTRARKHWTAKVSSVVIVELDTTTDPMTAKLVRRYERPDKGMTVLRGSAQVLPDGNVFAGWSSSAYFSEFSEDGTLLMEGHLGSNRMSTYRAFRYGVDEVTLFPAEPIALVCRTLQFEGRSKARKLSIMYVSWNGATEVRQWKFAVAHDEEVEGARFFSIGTKEKRGFETVAQLDGAGNFALVYGLDKDGNVLGKSEPVKCEDIVEVGSGKQPEDLNVGHGPPGASKMEHDEEKEADEGGALGGPTQSEKAPEASAKPATERPKGEHQQQEQDKEQERPPSEIIHPEDAHPQPVGSDQPLGTKYFHEDFAGLLFLSISFAGMLLLIRRFRRRIS